MFEDVQGVHPQTGKAKSSWLSNLMISSPPPSPSWEVVLGRIIEIQLSGSFPLAARDKHDPQMSDLQRSCSTLSAGLRGLSSYVQGLISHMLRYPPDAYPRLATDFHQTSNMW